MAENHIGAEPVKQAVESLKASGRWLRTFESFRTPNYRWIWVSMLASSIAFSMQNIARGWLVVEMTGSPLVLGIISSALGIPMLIVSPFGGVIADRVHKRNILIISQIGVFAVALVVTLLIQTENIAIWHLAITSVALGVIFSFSLPARQAIIPELVGEQSLMNALALNSTAMNLTRIAAPALGGLLVGVIGTAGVYWIITACYIVSIGSLLMIRIKMPVVGRSSRSIRADIVAGFNYTRKNTIVLTLLIVSAIIITFAMPYTILMPIFANDVLEVGSSGYGALMSMTGIGALVGSLIIATMSNYQHKGRLLLGFGLLFGVALVLFSVSNIFSLSLIILFVVGLAITGYIALNNTLLQLNTLHEMRGRVMSLFTVTIGLQPLGTLPAGAIAEVVGIAPVIGFGGIIALICIVVVGLTQHQVRKLS